MESTSIGTAALARRLADLEADPAFRALTRAQRRTNLFRVVGKTDQERWHSAFWSWILDPEGSHELRDFAIRQLLMRALDANGVLPTVRLEFDQESRHWKPAMAQTPLTAIDLVTLDVQESALAPGPLSGFREICPKIDIPPGQKKDSDLGRFDILLCVDGATRRGPLTLVIVLELKVRAAYKPIQLQTYSAWLHRDPSPDRLTVTTDSAEFVKRYRLLMQQAEQRTTRGELHALGVFLGVRAPQGLLSPDSLTPPWAPLTYREVVGPILEPMLADSQLDADARPLIQSYIDVALTEELSDMPTQEHKDLVQMMLNRHPETFHIIADILSGDADSAPDGEIIKEALDTGRNASLWPQMLFDAKVAAVGDLIHHSARKPKGADGPLFDGVVVARLTCGDRAGLEFVSGAGFTPGELPGRHSATGLLKALYSKLGYKFPRNGNDCWTFISGPSAAKTLSEAYDAIRE